MPKIAYAATNFSASSLEVIDHANQVCEDYAEQGYNLTLRQLYYQFVSRDWLPNDMKSYKRLGSIVNDARLAGLIDWDHLEDRTRNLSKLAMWDSPEAIVDAVARQYRTRLWDSQEWHVEVWVEKEALADVVSRPAERWLVPYFPCRGYVSQSEMWRAAQRLLEAEGRGKKSLIIHLGDHDPSGIDMSRDIRDRLWTFGSSVEVSRIALNMDQVEQYSPPPNPAKLTDSRAADYMERFGDESWELDALDPPTLDTLIEGHILDHLDRVQWDDDHATMEEQRAVLTAVSENWLDLAAYVRDSGWIQE
ncbi:MAG: uncharacterized protein JWM19_893 [Actinomycetia bacterium]|nr:uncharacterized protein [Actinomycetes bacterium]